MEAPEITEIRHAVRALCDAVRALCAEFVAELTESGFLTVLIPEAYGGAGLGLRRRGLGRL